MAVGTRYVVEVFQFDDRLQKLKVPAEEAYMSMNKTRIETFFLKYEICSTWATSFICAQLSSYLNPGDSYRLLGRRYIQYNPKFSEYFNTLNGEHND